MQVPYTTFSIRVTDPHSQKKTKLQGGGGGGGALEKIKLAAKTNSPPPPPKKNLQALPHKNGEPLYTLKYFDLLQIFGHRIKNNSLK